MAKRVRGSGRQAGRRSARRPSRPAASRPPAPIKPAAPGPPPSAGLTSDEERRAAEIEARIVAEERAAEELLSRSRGRGRAEAGRSFEPLAVRAAQEYAYVRRDVVRFVRLAAVLLGILAVLYVLINVVGVISI